MSAKNLFDSQTANGNSEEVTINQAYRNLSVVGTFDGCSIAIQVYTLGEWLTQEESSGVDVAITENVIYAVPELTEGKIIRLVLSSAGASTDISAEVN